MSAVRSMSPARVGIANLPWVVPGFIVEHLQEAPRRAAARSSSSPAALGEPGVGGVGVDHVEQPFRRGPSSPWVRTGRPARSCAARPSPGSREPTDSTAERGPHPRSPPPGSAEKPPAASAISVRWNSPPRSRARRKSLRERRCSTDAALGPPALGDRLSGRCRCPRGRPAPAAAAAAPPIRASARLARSTAVSPADSPDRPAAEAVRTSSSTWCSRVLKAVIGWCSMHLNLGVEHRQFRGRFPRSERVSRRSVPGRFSFTGREVSRLAQGLAPQPTTGVR